MARKLEIEIVGNADALHRAFRNAGTETESFGSRMLGVGKIAAVGLAAGIGVAAVAVDKLAKAAMGEQVVQARLAAQLQAVGVNYKAHAAQIDEVISKQEALSGFARDELTASLAATTRATGDLTEGFRLNALAADVARGRGVDIVTTATLVDKAYMGNVGALRRLGIDVQKVTTATDALKASHDKATAAQKEAAKAADALATKHELIATLEQKFGGQAEAYGHTAAGAMQRFHNSVHDLEVTLGTMLLPTIADVAEKLASVVGWTNDFVDAVKGLAAAGRDAGSGMDTAGTSAAHTGAQMNAGSAAAYRHADAIRLTRRAYDYLRAEAEKLPEIIAKVWRDITILWEGSGGTLSKITAKFMAIQKAVVVENLRNIRDIFQGISDVIHGHWGAAWHELTSIVSNTLGMIKAVVGGFASVLWIAASALGEAIVNGIISGLEGLFDAAKNKIKGALSGAIGWVKGNLGSTAFEHAASQLGKPIAEGTIQGWIEGTAALPSTMKETVRKAIEEARQVIAASRATLSTAWSQLASDAGSAFDGLAARLQTPTEKLIAAQDAARNTAQLQDTLKQTQTDLGAALKTGDQAQIQAAFRAEQEAEYQIKLAGEQKQAAAERVQLDARIALRKRHLDEALAQLETSLAKDGASHAVAQRKIIALLNSFGISYKSSGLALGNAFAQGIEDSIAAAVAAAKKLAAAADRYLPHSPAKEGPLSTLPNWNALLPSFDHDRAQVSIGRSLSGVAGAGGGGRGDMHVHLHLDGPVYGGDKKKFAEELAPEIAGALRQYQRVGGISPAMP